MHMWNLYLIGDRTAEGTLSSESGSHQKTNRRPHRTRVSFQNNWR